MTARLWIAFVALSLGSGLLGCGDAAQPRVSRQILPSSGQEAADASPTSQASPRIDVMDANAGHSVDVLARKTEAFSAEVAAILRNKGAGPQPPAVPSAVEWIDPKNQTATNTAAQTPGEPQARNVIDTTPPPVRKEQQPDARMEVASANNPQRNALPALGSDAMANKLSKRVKEYPRDVSAQLEYQLFQFLMDEPTPQLSVLSSLPPEDRELVTALLDGLTNFRNALRADNNMLLSQKIRPVLAMAERLRTQADLTIPNIALCTRVGGFGIYDPIDPVRFAADKDHQAIVYCEVANFTSNLNDQQQWETRLNWDMMLYTEQGMSVWSDKTETIQDQSRNRRHDFFVRKMITLPRTLTIGRYLLKVSIVDTQSNRVAEATLPIVVAAQ